MAERERPWQLLRPMAFEDVQVSAADATGADLNQPCLLGDGRPRYAADLRRGTWAGENRNPDLFHTLVLRITAVLRLHCILEIEQIPHNIMGEMTPTPNLSNSA